MKEKSPFAGIFPVVPTPLADDERLDLDGLGHLVEHYVNAGCHGLVILGSGGELPYFTAREKIEIVRTALNAARGRVPVVVGCGYVSLEETRSFFGGTESLPIAAYMSILPVYYPIGFDDVYRYYRTIGEESPKPILYYNYPQITGHFFDPDQMKRILELEGIVGIKESTLSVPDIKRHIAAVTEKPIRVFTGTTFILYRVLSLGGAGAICPMPSVAPHLVNDCYSAFARGDLPKARALQDDILKLVPLLNTFGLPLGLQKAAVRLLSHQSRPSRTAGRASRHAVIKETLRQLGHPITSRVRSPLPQVTEDDRNAVSALIERLGFLRRERIR
jgi:dihydrodipicolinate synthase/N-acetylneuraminate lyase